MPDSTTRDSRRSAKTSRPSSRGQARTLWIGIDEAGYGPNLGPLVVSATVWEIQGKRQKAKGKSIESDGDLSAGIRAPGPESSPFSHFLESLSGSGSPLIGDSKKLYSPARGIGPLEHGVLSMLACRTSLPSSLAFLRQSVCINPAEQFDGQPWYDGCDLPLPRKVESYLVGETADRARQAMGRAKIALRGVYSATVFPPQFNSLVDAHDSKAAALAHVLTDLLKHVLAAHLVPSVVGPQSSVPAAQSSPFGLPCCYVLVDKQGGRNHYQPLLQRAFPEHLVLREDEGRASSRYRVDTAGGRLEVSFQQGAERHVPVALASMFSKYLRELFMELFNRFWIERVPGLRPTAGYPVDARRFWDAIRPAQRQLGIPDHVLWRQR